MYATTRPVVEGEAGTRDTPGIGASSTSTGTSDAVPWEGVRDAARFGPVPNEERIGEFVVAGKRTRWSERRLAWAGFRGYIWFVSSGVAPSVCAAPRRA